MTTRPLGDRILVGGGVVTATVGTYLPWLKTNPDLPPNAEIPMILLPGMSAGFEGRDFALLGLIVLVLLGQVDSRERLQAVVTLCTGTVTVLVCAFHLSGSSLVGFHATFVPSPGWYLTVLGGVLLSLAGGRRLPPMNRRSGTTAAPND